MKKLIAIIIFQVLVPFGVNANENFSVEIEALTLVMEQYEKDIDFEPETDVDQNMGRTKNRPKAEGTISHNKALVFAIILALASFLSL